MKTQIYVLVALAACSGLLLPVSSAGLLESSATIYSSGVVQQTSTGTYSYIISVSGSNYQMTDGVTGQIVFQSTNSSQVFSNVVGNCSAGATVDVKTGVYTVNTMWLIYGVNGITVNFENGAELVAGNNLNTPVLYLNANNCEVSGTTINGNAVNQALGTYPLLSDGILIGGCNDEVSNALVYDCRQSGVETEYGSTGFAVHSGVINSKIYDCGWNGFTVGDPANVNCYLINSEIYGCSDVGATTYGVGTLMTGNYVHDMNGTTGGGGNSHWGIAVEEGGNDTITGNTVINCIVGIEVWGAYGTSFNTISSNNIQSVIQAAIDIGISSSHNLVNGNEIIQWDSQNTWKDAIDVKGNYNTVSGNTLNSTNPHASGIVVIGNYNQILSNNINTANTGDNIGICINGNNTDVVDNLIAGGCSGAGVWVNSGATSTVIENNDLAPCTQQKISDSGTATSIYTNPGYNPVGYIANPISGSTAYLVDSGSNFAWISAKVYTNTESLKVLNISGGTVSAVVQDGVTLFTMTNCTVTLQPGDTFSVTFSTAPTIKVTGQ